MIKILVVSVFAFCFLAHSDSYFKNLEASTLRHRDGISTGLCDCREYRELGPNPSADGCYFVTLVYHSDGALAQRAGKLKLHPVQFSVCELPWALQKSLPCTTLAAIYVGYAGTNLNRLLEPVCGQLDVLENEGFQVETCRGLKRFRIRVFFATVDLVERAKLLNMVNFNGRFGCSICKIQTQSLGKARSRYLHQR